MTFLINSNHGLTNLIVSTQLQPISGSWIGCRFDCLCRWKQINTVEGCIVQSQGVYKHWHHLSVVKFSNYFRLVRKWSEIAHISDFLIPGGQKQGMAGLAENGSNWPQMWQTCDFLGTVTLHFGLSVLTYLTTTNIPGLYWLNNVLYSTDQVNPIPVLIVVVFLIIANPTYRDILKKYRKRGITQIF